MAKKPGNRVTNVRFGFSTARKSAKGGLPDPNEPSAKRTMPTGKWKKVRKRK